MNLGERITIEPGKCGEHPCIRGLRIRVKDILGLLAAGASHQEILKDYPDLEETDILAALSYAAQQSTLSFDEDTPITQADIVTGKLAPCQRVAGRKAS